MKRLLCLACLAVFVVHAQAQVPPEPKLFPVPFFWVDGFLGVTSLGLGGGYRLHLDPGLLLVVGAQGTAKFCLRCEDPSDMTEYNLWVGKRLRYGLWSLYAMAGLGRVQGHKGSTSYRNSYEGVEYIPKPFSTMGIPIDFGFSVAEFIGIGLNVHANLNNKNPMIGANLVVSIGYINPSSFRREKED